MRNVSVLVSNLDRSGPCLGALAFTQLCGLNKVKCELLTRKNLLPNELTDSVRITSVGNYCKLWFKLNFKLNSSHLISFDFKTDVVNILSRGKSIIYIRADNKENYRDTFGFIFGSLLYYCHLILLLLADEVWVLSKVIEGQLNIPLLRNKIYVIPNFISQLSSFDIKKDKDSFLIVSSLIRRKRVLSTVESFLKIYRYNSCVSLTIIGQGYLENELRDLLNSEEFDCTVHFINESIQPIDYFLRSEYFILMSSSEGLSRAALEASNYGCKLILSDIPVHREYFSDFSELIKTFNGLTNVFKEINSGNLFLRPAFPLRCSQSSVIQRILNRIK